MIGVPISHVLLPSRLIRNCACGGGDTGGCGGEAGGSGDKGGEGGEDGEGGDEGGGPERISQQYAPFIQL